MENGIFLAILFIPFVLGQENVYRFIFARPNTPGSLYRGKLLLQRGHLTRTVTKRDLVQAAQLHRTHL